LQLTKTELDDEHERSLRTPYRQWTHDLQLCCAWAKATSDAATRTTRAVRDTNVLVPLLRPEVPCVGRTLRPEVPCVGRTLLHTRESCVCCVCVCVCVCVFVYVITLPGLDKLPNTVGTRDGRNFYDLAWPHIHTHKMYTSK
jgi:hypothetical protein